MGNARAYMDYLLACGIRFRLTTSNYNMKIEATDLDKKFIATEQSKRTFAIFAKLKHDLKDKPVPKINSHELIYFQHDFKESMYVEKVINIDLKSAYATFLYNDGIISEATFDYLCNASKKERLAGVGMLASRKRIFDFYKGEPIGNPIVEVSPFAGFFFHAVRRTYDVMSDLKMIVGQQYLFTWVDGIYFLPGQGSALSDCIEYLESIGIKYTVDNLSEFEVKIKQDKCVVTFKKDGKNKIFQLPSVSTEFKRISLEAIQLLNKKLKENEKRIGKKIA